MHLFCLVSIINEKFQDRINIVVLVLTYKVWTTYFNQFVNYHIKLASK